MNRKNSHSEQYSDVNLMKIASFENPSHTAEEWRIVQSVNSGKSEELFKEEPTHFSEPERKALVMYFEVKMEELLREISSRQMGAEGTMRDEKLEFENMLTTGMQDEGKRLTDQLRSKWATRLKQVDEELEREAVGKKTEMEKKLKKDESRVEGSFNLRLKEAEMSLQILKDEFKTHEGKRRAIIGKQSQDMITEPGERLEAEFQKILRKDMSYEKKEAAREKSETETKVKKDKRQLEKNFFLRLTEAETNLRLLKTEVQQMIETEKENRRKLAELEEKLKSEYQAIIRRQISHEKEEARRDKVKMEERFLKEKVRLEESFNRKLSEAETGLKRLKAELQQRERMEKENRDTIMKLEAKLQEERQLRLDAERELQRRKTEFSTEQFLNRNENERLRNEIEGLRREIENKREIVERELEQKKVKCFKEECLNTNEDENVRNEVDAHRHDNEDKGNTENEIKRREVKNTSERSLNANENECLRDEVDTLRREIEEKNKEIEKLLGVKKDNELKVLSLARRLEKRLEKRTKRDSKEADSRRRKYDGQIDSPERLSNKTTSEEGEKRSSRNSWDLEGSLPTLGDVALRTDRLTNDCNAVLPVAEETRKILVFVTFEKRNERGILRFLTSLLPRQNFISTVRVSMA